MSDLLALPAETVLQARIKERLALIHRSPRDVSLKAGLGPDAIRTIMSGRSQSPRGKSLKALAKELDCEVSYLLGEIDTPHFEGLVDIDRNGNLTGAVPLNVHLVLSLDWGRGFVDYSQDGLDPKKFAFQSSVYSIPDFSPMRQDLDFVSDDHANLILPKGSFAHYMALELDDGGVELNDQDVVILDRQKLLTDDANGKDSQIQRSIRQVRLFGDTLVLRTLSTVPDLQEELAIPDAQRLRDGNFTSHLGEEGFSIAGIVLRCVSHIHGPPIVRRAIELT